MSLSGQARPRQKRVEASKRPTCTDLHLPAHPTGPGGSNVGTLQYCTVWKGSRLSNTEPGVPLPAEGVPDPCVIRKTPSRRKYKNITTADDRNCPSAGEWFDKLGYVRILEHCEAVKNHERSAYTVKGKYPTIILFLLKPTIKQNHMGSVEHETLALGVIEFKPHVRPKAYLKNKRTP